MTGLCLVTRGFICSGNSGDAICPPPIVGGGGVIREEVEKPKPTIKVLKALYENEHIENFDRRMKNVKIEINNVSIKLGD